MEYKIEISPGANDRMYEHFLYLAQINEAAANRLLSTLVKGIQSLSENPRRNPPYERPYTRACKYRYLFCAKRYRIVYMIFEDTVFIDDIQDCRENDDNSIISDSD